MFDDSQDSISKLLTLRDLVTEAEMSIHRYFNNLTEPSCYFHILLSRYMHCLRYCLSGLVHLYTFLDALLQNL